MSTVNRSTSISSLLPTSAKLASELNNMSDILNALGPGRKLDSLARFAPDYVAVRRAFNNLLVFPHLDLIEIGDTFNLQSLVIDGDSRFSGLSNIDSGLARKVISYHVSFSALVDAFDIQLLVKTLQPVAQEYADHARAHSEANLKFFADFTDYIASVDWRICSLDTVLEQLDSQIQGQSEALAKKDIVTTLREALNTLYKLASTDEDADVQIAAILGVTVQTTAGSFKNLFDDQHRLQKIISSLKGLLTRIQDLKTKFVALSVGLKNVSINSQSLLDAWDDVAARMGTVTDHMNLDPLHQPQQLKNVWAKVAIDAKDYIEVLQRSSSNLPRSVSANAVESHRVTTAKFNAFPKVPITEDEIHLHKLAVAHGHNGLVCAPGPSSRSRENLEEKVVEKVLGPPAETQKRLENLADDTGIIINQFNKLLQLPFLDQFACTHPIDGSASNLLTVMNFCRERYLKLQQDTLPVVRDLRTYAQLQRTLLPFLVPDDQAQGMDLRVSQYFATNAPRVKKNLEEAEKLAERSTEVKNEWVKVINEVNKLINESKSKMDTLEASINELTMPRQKTSLFSFLFGLGFFVAFTASVFLPRVGMLASLSGAATLGELLIREVIKYSKLTTVINELKSAIETEENTISKLDALLPYIKSVGESLSMLSGIWSDITTTSKDLDNFYSILNKDPTILNLLRQGVLDEWVTVLESVDKYIHVVL